VVGTNAFNIQPLYRKHRIVMAHDCPNLVDVVIL